MNRAEAAEMMTTLIRTHGLEKEGWRFTWMARKRTLGLCKYTSKELLLSVHYVDRNDKDRVYETCLHEIAHALTPGAKHGLEWQRKAMELGIVDPKPCSEADMPEGRWVAFCPNCSKRYSKHRAPKLAPGRFYFCPPCWKMSGHLPKDERVKRSQLAFHDTAPSVVSTPRTPVAASVSAEQNTPTQTVALTPAGSSQSFTAPQVAEAMGVDAKSFRAWLRRVPNMEREFKSTGAWLFPADKIQSLVRLWNATH